MLIMSEPGPMGGPLPSPLPVSLLADSSTTVVNILRLMTD